MLCLSVYNGRDGVKHMIKLERLPYDLTVCKISSAADAPLETDFFFLEKTDEELSLVCETRHVPLRVVAREDGWRGFRVSGTMEFSLVGILAGIADILAEQQISIFAVSTYDTDYILVKQENFEKALKTLAGHGYTVRQDG